MIPECALDLVAELLGKKLCGAHRAISNSFVAKEERVSYLVCSPYWQTMHAAVRFDLGIELDQRHCRLCSTFLQEEDEIASGIQEVAFLHMFTTVDIEKLPYNRAWNNRIHLHKEYEPHRICYKCKLYYYVREQCSGESEQEEEEESEGEVGDTLDS